ncbi:hypothetical protein [Halobacillus yeomjeoni]|uniref:TubC N-terminal docking domain-containing protein n=1 Tax=Halobacillus yeomjeoni TaxID=311194 RepID=A0A931MTP4_9BACI|nr:hypothetical protein [Halobacillus yeomjeoni]MBH0228837.1 hypothetical protein [Halobacillus yeomjeoni]
MIATEIIHLLESEGYEIQIRNGRLVVPQGKAINPSLVAMIKDYKVEITSILNRDEELQGIGFCIGLYGSLYLKSTSENSFIFMEFMGGYWELRRETFVKSNSTAVNLKVLSSGCYSTVFNRAKGYLDYLKNRKRETR